jgi:hypothetical protein
MLTQKSPKISKNFECEKCNYKCSRQSEYTKHLLTAKHKNLTNLTKKSPKVSKPYQCNNCEKGYVSRMGLWQHLNKCNHVKNNQCIPPNLIQDSCYDDTIKADKTLFIDILKQNQEFTQLMIEQSKQLQQQQCNTNKLYQQTDELHKQLIDAVKSTNTNTNIHNQTINNNQKFNLNFFLNTTCKDAMNMSEFIENMHVEFKDIENIGKKGYVVGMTNMILSRIKELDITKRPLHCTDLKRETMYIKDNDEWSKDNDENEKLRDMISIVAKQNYNVVPLWRKHYPDCNVSEHPSYNLCMDMMRNIIGDVGPAHSRLDNKVIKNISRHINVK